MKRDLARLSDGEHDVVVVGGGIQGAWIAWDAALRGLRVALVERDDFGGATSAGSLRIVHGGLRYLARGDLRRMQASIRERSALLRIAPALVEPLPVLVPTTGLGAYSRAAMRAALAANDLLSLHRNQGLAPSRRLPAGRLLSLDQCRLQFGAFPASRTSGGALWYDARLRHPERLTLSLVRSAVARGAAAANYCRADRVLVEGGRAVGIAVSDLAGGGTASVRARRVVIAAGPWTTPLSGGDPARSPLAFGLNLEVPGRLAEVAVGVRSPSDATADPVIGGRRFIFLVPQATTTLLGTWYAPWPPGATDAEALIRQGTSALLAEFRAACPGIDLAEPAVTRPYWGLLPLKQGREIGRPDALADRDRVLDHGALAGPQGMFSVEGVKFTTARGTAEVAVDGVMRSLGRAGHRCTTRTAPVEDASVPAAAVSADQVRSAIREEMAVRLSDLMLRRIWLTAPAGVTRPAVVDAARIAAAELGWSAAREQAEIDDVLQQLTPLGRTTVPPV